MKRNKVRKVLQIVTKAAVDAGVEDDKIAIMYDLCFENLLKMGKAESVENRFDCFGEIATSDKLGINCSLCKFYKPTHKCDVFEHCMMTLEDQEYYLPTKKQ